MRLVGILIKNGSVAIAERYADRDRSTYTNASLIETAGGYMKQKQLKKGEALISKALGGCGISPDESCDYALFLTARAYYLAARPDTAMKYAQQIVAIDMRTQTLVEIAGAARDESLALKAVEIAKKHADRCQGDNCRYVAMWIAQGYGAAGRADKAVGYLNQHVAKAPIDYAIGLEMAVRQLAKRGKIKDAARLLNQQPTSSPSTDQMKQALAVAELKNGSFESALSTVESIPNSFAQFEAAITLAKVKPDFPFIQKWLTRTRPDDRQIEVYAGTVQVLLASAARNGHTTEARRYVETLNNPLLKARGLIGIAQGLLRKQPGEEWARSLELTW